MPPPSDFLQCDDGFPAGGTRSATPAYGAYLRSLSLWLSLGFHNRVHVMALHVGREQIPAAITTYLLNGFHTASRRIWSM